MDLDGKAGGRQCALCTSCRQKTTGLALKNLVQSALKSPDQRRAAKRRRHENGSSMSQAYSQNPQQGNKTLSAPTVQGNGLNHVLERLDTFERAIGGLSRRADSADAERVTLHIALTTAINNMTNCNQQLTAAVDRLTADPTRQNLPIAPPRPPAQERPGVAPAGPNTPAREGPHPKYTEHQGQTYGKTLSYIAPNTDVSKPQLATLKDTPNTSAESRPSWASIAARPSIDSVNHVLQSRIQSTRFSLAASGFAPTPVRNRRPDAVAAYFGGVPSGPKGAFRRILLADHSIPRWALLGISFVGNGIAEIVTHSPLMDRLVAVMRLLGYRHLKSHDPAATSAVIRKFTTGHSSETTTLAVTACARRWGREIRTSKSAAAKAWYTTQIDKLVLKYPSVKDALVTDNVSAAAQANTDNEMTADTPSQS